MGLDDQLEKAILRGKERNANRLDLEKQKLLTAEEIRNRHNLFRLNLSDYIEESLRKLAQHLPGFEYETIYGERGWGGALYREDLTMGAKGRAGAFFSRVEITVRPQNEFNVVNIAGKGTVKDKEIFTWNHFKDISEATDEEFKQTIDSWIIQYAEQFAAR